MTKKINISEYPFICAKIVRHDVTINSSINHKIRANKDPDRDEKIYTADTTLKIEATCNYPDECMDYKCSISVFGEEQYKDQFSSVLKDYHKIDEKWNRVYKKTPKGEVPIYEIPSGIGYLSKHTKDKFWNGAVWVQPEITTDMLILLSHATPLYIELHVQKAARNNWHVIGFSLKTENPAET
jgi:hypothetical protein